QMTKPTSWWAGVLGKELIGKFGLTAGGQTLGQWLATTFPNLYGGGNGASNLSGFSNAQVAAFYLNQFNMFGTSILSAEVMAVALDVFATTLSLGGTVAAAAPYNFMVNAFG